MGGPLRGALATIAAALVACGCWALAGLEDRSLIESGEGGAPDAPLADGPADANRPEAACATAGDCDGGAECFDSVCGGRAILKVEASNRTNCVLRKAGTVWCWGNNSTGIVAPGGSPGTYVPQRVPVLTHATELVGGDGFMCAVQDKRAYCWGGNDQNQLGHDRSLDSATPTPVDGVDGVLRLALGRSHACALTLKNEVWCWGSNFAYELGQADAGAYVRPVLAASNVNGVAAGGAATCVRKQQGATIECWGEFGGAPDPAAHSVVQGVDKPGEIVMSGGSACAGVPSGVCCWGAGDGTWGSTGDAGAGAPFAATCYAMPGARALSGKANHVCLVSDGALFCWGRNVNANLMPVKSPGTCLTGMVCPPLSPMLLGNGNERAVSVSNYSNTAVLLEDGRVLLWGLNGAGVLGHEPFDAGDVACDAFGGSSATACNPQPQAHPLLP